MRFDSVSVTRPYEQIVSQIEAGIRDGQLTVGQQLPTERELGRQFGVGRGVVREAIKVLDAMGLVESRQGSGIYVRNDPLPTVSRVFTFVGSVSEESIGQLFEFRQALEVIAARWAARNRTQDQADAIRECAEATRSAAFADATEAFSIADQRFHQEIFEATANPYLAATLGAVRGMQTEVIALVTRSVGSIQVAAEHHLAIADGIAQGNEALAASVMETHISYTAARVSEMIPSQRERLGQEGGVDNETQ